MLEERLEGCDTGADYRKIGFGIYYKLRGVLVFKEIVLTSKAKQVLRPKIDLWRPLNGSRQQVS